LPSHVFSGSSSSSQSISAFDSVDQIFQQSFLEIYIFKYPLYIFADLHLSFVNWVLYTLGILPTVSVASLSAAMPKAKQYQQKFRQKWLQNR